MRKGCILVVVLLVLLPGAAAAATTQSCGGLAPVVPGCGFSGTLAAVNSLDIDTGPLFTGRISVTIATVTGAVTFECRYAPATPRECARTDRDYQLPGQTYTLTARAEPAAGRWRVTYEN